MDINTGIKRIIKTGKVQCGAKETINAILNGKAKLVIITKNCPEQIKKDVQHYAKISEIPAVEYNGTSMELGEICGKPFVVSTMTVLNSGDINIKELTEATK